MPVAAPYQSDFIYTFRAEGTSSPISCQSAVAAKPVAAKPGAAKPTPAAPTAKAPKVSKAAVANVYASQDAKQRNEAYNRLTIAAKQCGETVPVPEIVVVGGQSDGKSSLLEAFLGFRFNLREVEMGTRRPLVVQMNHTEGFEEPECCFQEESGPRKAQFSAPVPTEHVAEEIRRRTQEVLEAKGGDAAVSETPLVMRVRYVLHESDSHLMTFTHLMHTVFV